MVLLQHVALLQLCLEVIRPLVATPVNMVRLPVIHVAISALPHFARHTFQEEDDLSDKIFTKLQSATYSEILTDENTNI